MFLLFQIVVCLGSESNFWGSVKPQKQATEKHVKTYAYAIVLASIPKSSTPKMQTKSATCMHLALQARSRHSRMYVDEDALTKFVRVLSSQHTHWNPPHPGDSWPPRFQHTDAKEPVGPPDLRTRPAANLTELGVSGWETSRGAEGRALS